MIIAFKRKNGSTAILTADHFFHHVEEGKDECIKIKGSKIHIGINTFFLVKDLENVYVYDYGRVIWRKIFL